MYKKTFYLKKSGIYLLYFMLWLFVHMFCVKFGDDTYRTFEGAGLVFLENLWNDYLIHVQQWSSRFLIDFIGRFLYAWNFAIWRIVDSLIWCIFISQVEQIVFKEKDLEKTLVLMFTSFLLPFMFFGTAGWIATTITYFWPVVAGTYVVKLINNIYNETENKVWQYGIGVVCFLYAIDLQQMCIIMFVIFSLYVYLFAKKSKKIIHIILLASVSFARIILHLNWGGTDSRYVQEIANWYPDYEMLSLFDKIQIGFSSACNEIYCSNNILFLLLASVLVYLVFENSSDKFTRVISFVPAILIVGFGLCADIITKIFPSFYSLISYDSKYGLIQDILSFNISAYIYLFIWGFGIICLIWSLYKAFEASNLKWGAPVVFLCGFGARFIMAFSPTVFASGQRTYTFMYIAVFIIVLYMYERSSKQVRNILFYILIVAGGVSYIDMFMKVYAMNLQYI